MGLVGLGDVDVLDSELRADGCLVIRAEEPMGEACNDCRLANCSLSQHHNFEQEIVLATQLMDLRVNIVSEFFLVTTID